MQAPSYAPVPYISPALPAQTRLVSASPAPASMYSSRASHGNVNQPQRLPSAQRNMYNAAPGYIAAQTSASRIAGITAPMPVSTVTVNPTVGSYQRGNFATVPQASPKAYVPSSTIPTAGAPASPMATHNIQNLEAIQQGSLQRNQMGTPRQPTIAVTERPLYDVPAHSGSQSRQHDQSAPQQVQSCTPVAHPTTTTYSSPMVPAHAVQQIQGQQPAPLQHPNTVYLPVNDYYKSPNARELAPGDTMGLKTTYDSYLVRTFCGEVTEKKKDRDHTEKSSNGDDYTDYEDDSYYSSSEYNDRRPSGSPCRCRHSCPCRGGQGRPTCHNGRDSKKPWQTADRDIDDDDTTVSSHYQSIRYKAKRPLSSEVARRYNLTKELHIHHCHCPYRIKSTSNKHQQQSFGKTRDRDGRFDVDDSESTCSTETEYLIRASSPKARGSPRKSALKNRNSKQTFVGSPSRPKTSQVKHPFLEATRKQRRQRLH